MTKSLLVLGRTSTGAVVSLVFRILNQSAIHLAKNPSFHSRTKHIEVRYHWIRDVVSSKLLKLEKILTGKNGSDKMTKILPSEKLLVCCKVAGERTFPN